MAVERDLLPHLWDLRAQLELQMRRLTRMQQAMETLATDESVSREQLLATLVADLNTMRGANTVVRDIIDAAIVIANRATSSDPSSST